MELTAREEARLRAIISAILIAGDLARGTNADFFGPDCLEWADEGATAILHKQDLR